MLLPYIPENTFPVYGPPIIGERLKFVMPGIVQWVGLIEASDRFDEDLLKNLRLGIGKIPRKHLIIIFTLTHLHADGLQALKPIFKCRLRI